MLLCWLGWWVLDRGCFFGVVFFLPSTFILTWSWLALNMGGVSSSSMSEPRICDPRLSPTRYYGWILTFSFWLDWLGCWVYDVRSFADDLGVTCDHTPPDIPPPDTTPPWWPTVYGRIIASSIFGLFLKKVWLTIFVILIFFKGRLNRRYRSFCDQIIAIHNRRKFGYENRFLDMSAILAKRGRPNSRGVDLG